MKTSRSLTALRLCLAFSAIALVPDAFGKPWKGAEIISRQTYKYGAFEARIQAAKGSGMITPFFLWKDGSELAGAQWQEQDFETFGYDGSFQTQVMTPGNPRVEHVVRHRMEQPVFDRYNTYRMEWTPYAVSFYVNGYLVRRETDQKEFAKLLDPAKAEPAQIRVGVWAGDFAWSGPFDALAVPAATYVNWMKVYSYTPGAGENGSDFSLAWTDEFDAWDPNRWWTANWTFEFAVNDYVSQNAAVRDGYLVAALTTEANSGVIPTPPVDDGLEPSPIGGVLPLPPVVVPARLEAETPVRYYDRTATHYGDKTCGDGPLDMQATRDIGGGCNVGYTDPNEWLEWEITSPGPKSIVYDLAARAATAVTGAKFRIFVDGKDVSGVLTPVPQGWQTFQDIVVPELTLTPGVHIVRLVFETQNVNLNWVELRKVREIEPITGIQLPGLMEAENFAAANDLTAGNSGGACTVGDADFETTGDVLGGGCSAGWTQAGEWLEYDITSPADAVYDLEFRIASAFSGRSLKVLLDGNVVGARVEAPADGWQVYSNVLLPGVPVTAGAHKLRILWNEDHVNINWIRFTEALPPDAPAQVVGLAGSAGNASVSLSWTASPDADNYKVFRSSPGSEATEIGRTAVPAYTDATVTNGVTYTYTVVARNIGGDAAASAPVELTPVEPPPVLPVQVTGLVAAAGDARVVLSWLASSDALTYRVLRSVSGAAPIEVAQVSALGYTDLAVLNGTSYTYTVVAVNAVGSAPASIEVVARPQAPTVGLKAQYAVGTTGSTNGIRPLLKVVNTSAAPIALSDVKVRYWFTRDGATSFGYWCDWAQIGSSNVRGSFASVSPARTNADTYLEISFLAAAGNLAAGASTGDIQSRFSKSDWSNFNQANDASYGATATSYQDWSKVTVYHKGVLVWGVEP